MSLGSFSVDNNNDVACMETVELLLNRQGYRCINILGSLVSVAPGVTSTESTLVCVDTVLIEPHLWLLEVLAEGRTRCHLPTQHCICSPQLLKVL